MSCAYPSGFDDGGLVEVDLVVDFVNVPTPRPVIEDLLRRAAEKRAKIARWKAWQALRGGGKPIDREIDLDVTFG